MKDALIAGLIRAGRVLLAAAISAAVVAIPQAVGEFHLPAEVNGTLIFLLTAALNGVGKLLRDAKDVPTGV